jgi:hypothetical protein
MTGGRSEKVEMTHKRQRTHASPLWGALYAALLMLTTLYSYFKMVTFPWYIVQFSYAAVIGVGVLWVFVSGEVKRIGRSVSLMLFQMLPLLLTLVWSLLIWVYHQQTITIIRRGSSMLLYQLLLMCMLIWAGVMFGEHAIEYTTWGFVAGNGMILLDVARRYGVGTTISSLISFFVSVGANDNSVSFALEIHDLTFAMGILAGYYLFYGKGEHWRWLYAALTTFFFVLGWKRIAIPGVIAMGVYRWIMAHLSPAKKRWFTYLIGVSFIVIGMGYVVLIRQGIWVELCDRFGIDLMGRDRLYSRIESYYTLHPLYAGIGHGMVSVVLQNVESKGIRGLHSDILRSYIELGMIVFLLWMFLLFVYSYRHLEKHYSQRAAEVYMAAALFIYITYLTDNTATYYHTQLAWHILPLCAFFRDSERIATEVERKEREEWKAKRVRSRQQKKAERHAMRQIPRSQSI